MLRKRVITAVIMFSLFIPTIFYLSTPYFASITGLIILVGIWEWTRLIGYKKTYNRLLIVILLLSMIALTIFYKLPIPWLLYMNLGCWVLGFIVILFYPSGISIIKNKFLGIIAGYSMLFPAWIAINVIRGDYFIPGIPFKGSPMMLIFVCFLVWGADIGAYFFGKFYGKIKLAKSVSPGKTWEGIFGALLTTVIIVWLTSITTNILTLNNWNLTFTALLSLTVVIFSVIGDLVESLFKRAQGVKDSGSLLPGHGGVLDRIDGLLAGFPVFLLLSVV